MTIAGSSSKVLTPGSWTPERIEAARSAAEDSSIYIYVYSSMDLVFGFLDPSLLLALFYKTKREQEAAAKKQLRILQLREALQKRQQR